MSADSLRRFGYVRVCAATPRVVLADCDANARHIIALLKRADDEGADVVVFPELSVTGYTCGDLFLQPKLLHDAERALAEIAEAATGLHAAAIVGVPVAAGGRIFNCAAVVADGEVRGVVPKINIPNYSEFYEARWFASGAGIEGRTLDIAGSCGVPFGTDLLFAACGAAFGVELCEDLWVPVPPSSHAAQAGAQIIFNLSASPEQVCKYDYVRGLVAQQSARTIAAYVYSSAGWGESTTDLVFAGNALIAEYGAVLRSGERFAADDRLTMCDVDVERLDAIRMRTTTFAGHGRRPEYRTVVLPEVPGSRAERRLERDVDPMPFVPRDGAELDGRCREILDIQSSGLARRIEHTGCRRVVIGISGGLDSTLALLVAVKAFERLKMSHEGIIGVTMPGFGTTGRTYDNAVSLVRGVGATLREIPIIKACEQHFEDIGLPAGDRSVSYENSQARERTQILMDVANMEGAIVVGTGDLSELALGWATYNGDHMSMYGVNASVPKTLVRHLVEWIAGRVKRSDVAAILRDIAATPVSPELLPADENGEIAQRTEDLVGPYELHDFFLYNFVRQQFAPSKIEFLATGAFDGRYDRATIRKWLRTFLRRFFAQQFKRSAMPDGPKTGSVSLSPRGDWRMPSDAVARAWLEQADE